MGLITLLSRQFTYFYGVMKLALVGPGQEMRGCTPPGSVRIEVFKYFGGYRQSESKFEEESTIGQIEVAG